MAAWEPRLYGFCAKGGEAKPESTSYVCPDHKGPGSYWFCANCGKAWEAESWDYVCWDCLVIKPGAEHREPREEVRP